MRLVSNGLSLAAHFLHVAELNSTVAWFHTEKLKNGSEHYLTPENNNKGNHLDRRRSTTFLLSRPSRTLLARVDVDKGLDYRVETETLHNKEEM